MEDAVQTWHDLDILLLISFLVDSFGDRLSSDDVRLLFQEMVMNNRWSALFGSSDSFQQTSGYGEIRHSSPDYDTGFNG